MPKIIKRYPRLASTVTEREHGLTDRQVEILELAANAYGPREIAEKLDLSVITVTDHLDRLRDRFHAANRVDLVSQAWAHGVMQPRLTTGATPAPLWKIRLFQSFRRLKVVVAGFINPAIPQIHGEYLTLEAERNALLRVRDAGNARRVREFYKKLERYLNGDEKAW